MPAEHADPSPPAVGREDVTGPDPAAPALESRPPDLRRAIAYGFVVALLVAPFLVFAVGVGSGYALSATAVVLGVFAATWAWCTWLLRSGRGPWLLATFLVAVAAVAVVIAIA